MSAADLIKSFESCKLTAYLDPYGKRCTVGWGHTDIIIKWITIANSGAS
jgi:GH24 family phage-related lysozyme (muramidase)